MAEEPLSPRVENPYRIKVESFEGPLDLLLYLIKKNELDVCEVSLSKIGEEYLNFVYNKEMSNLENAGEFILVAATLILIKSRALLPEDEQLPLEDEDEIESPEELIKRLLEYKKYKEAGQELRKNNTLFDTVFKRGGKDPVMEEIRNAEPLLEVKPSELMKAFERILRRTAFQTVHEIRGEPIPTSIRINQIFDRMKKIDDLSFDELFDDCKERHMVIVTFISILEMARLSVVRIYQTESFRNIRLKSRITEIEGAEEMIRHLLTQDGEIPSFTAEE